MSDVPTPPPARPERLSVRWEQSGDRLWLVHRNRGRGGGCFLTLWLIGWTVGCVFLAGMVIRDPKLLHFLFAVPFWASWVFVFALVLRSFFQREQFLLDREGAVFLRRVFVPLCRREVPLSEIKQFAEYSRVTDSENGTRSYGLEMQTVGQPLKFAEGLEEPERNWLLYTINEHLANLRLVYGGAQPAAATQDSACEVAPDRPPDVTESFGVRAASRSTALCQPPSDAGWQRVDDFDSIAFTQRGRLSLVALFGLLFVNLFWNGIVGVFVLQLFDNQAMQPLQGVEWWGLAVFLIPFEVIGLLMFATLIAMLLEPVRRTTWRFGRSDIECRLTWFGLGRCWNYMVADLQRIDLHAGKSSGEQSQSPAQAMRNMRGQGSYRLSFVDKSNREVCSVKGLTEGEARWVADVVRRERPVWFR